MDVGIPPFEIKIVLESNSLKSTMLVGGLGVRVIWSARPSKSQYRIILCVCLLVVLCLCVSFYHTGSFVFVFWWSGLNSPAWCSGGRRPLIAGRFSLQRLGVGLPITRPVWDSNLDPASESRPLTNCAVGATKSPPHHTYGLMTKQQHSNNNVCVCMYVYIYIYMYIYIYIYMYIYIVIQPIMSKGRSVTGARWSRWSRWSRRSRWAGPVGPVGPVPLVPSVPSRWSRQSRWIGRVGRVGPVGPVGRVGRVGRGGRGGRVGPVGRVGRVGPIGAAGAAGPFGPIGAACLPILIIRAVVLIMIIINCTRL